MPINEEYGSLIEIVEKLLTAKNKYYKTTKQELVEYWKLQIFNAPKCTNHRMYKSEFGLEKYFTIHNIFTKF
jgi:hypothetical protein